MSDSEPNSDEGASPADDVKKQNSTGTTTGDQTGETSGDHKGSLHESEFYVR